MFVRLGLEEDENAIVEMAELNCQLSTPYLTFNADKVRETYRRYISDCETTFFVVDDRRAVVGFLMATINGYRHADGLYTTQEVLFVRPEYRGSRAAVLLMKELIRWSQLLKAIEITGGNDNSFQSDRTAKFLEHFGFENVGNFMRRKM